jgi:hypothetical protein
MPPVPPLARYSWFVLSLAGMAQIQQIRPLTPPVADQALVAFERELRTSKQPVLLLLEGGDAAWIKKAEGLLATPEMRELDLSATRLGPTTPLAQELLRQKGWTAEPRWVLFNREGTVPIQDVRLPSGGGAWAWRLRNAGLKTPVEELEGFLRQHPDNLDARGVLINTRLRLAQAHLKTVLDPKGELVRPLSSEEDTRLFRPLAKELERLLADPYGPMALPHFAFLPGDPERQSPTLQALAHRARPALEAWLRRAPQHAPAWELLATFSVWTSRCELLDLLPSLEPYPSVYGQSRPRLPEKALAHLGQEARRTRRWDPLLPVLQPGVDALLGRGGGLPSPKPDDVWDKQGISLLVEALLNLGRTGEATTLVQTFLEWGGGSPRKAAELALASGRVDLAKAWGTLSPTWTAKEGNAFSPEIHPQLSLDRLLRMVQDRPPASLVLITGEKGVPYPALSALSRKAPLMEWNLNLQALPMTGEAAQALRAREGWSPEPRWSLMAAEGRILASGTAPPTPEELVARLTEANLKPPVAQMRSFLRDHADHLEALAALLDERRNQGLRTKPPTAKGPLSEEEDRAVWGECAQVLERFVAQPGWPAAITYWRSSMGTEMTRSALMAEAYRRALPGIEDILRRGSSAIPMTWTLWSEAIVVAGAEPTLLLEEAERWPGASEVFRGGAERQLVSYLKVAERWATLERLLLPTWKAVQEGRAFTITGNQESFVWDLSVGSLLEAYLRQGKLSQAETLLRDAQALVPGNGLLLKAATLARTCDLKDLAIGWEARAKAM